MEIEGTNVVDMARGRGSRGGGGGRGRGRGNNDPQMAPMDDRGDENNNPIFKTRQPCRTIYCKLSF
jgi:hypothetical protein